MIFFKIFLKGSCDTYELDNEDNDQWAEGQTDLFSGSEIGDCNNKYVGDPTDPAAYWEITLFHSGSGGATLDFARISFFGVDQQINCELFGHLFDDTYNETFECEIFGTISS